MSKTKDTNRLTAIGELITNGASDSIEIQKPYRSVIQIEGLCPLLFHRWNCESIEAKAKAKKGSDEKKSDNVESYLWRNETGNVCIPGEYLRQSIIHAAKYEQDPRSPRKSMMDLAKAAIVSLTELGDTGLKEPDYLDQRRVTVQRAGITRIRPALKQGWKAEFMFMVNLPEYMTPQKLNYLAQQAGRLVGLADFRPSYGRFAVTRFELLD